MGVNSASGSASASASATATAGANTDSATSNPQGSEGSEGSEGSDSTADPETESGDDTEGSSGTAGSGSTAGDATSTTASTTSGETGSGTGSTGGSESSGGMGDACTGMPLDAQLDVPPMCSPTCDGIGFGSDCPGIEICRLKDSQTAVCESCAPCGNLHAPCTASSQCDILFTCFMGQCTAMCDKTTPQTCGNPPACTEVGHPTHGVCNPNI